MLKKTTKHTLGRRSAALLLALSLITASLAGCNSGKKAAEAQERFDAFTNEVFVSDITENILNLHWTLAFPENYGIEDYEISFGSFSKEYEEESYRELRDMLKELKEFDYDLLTEEQKLIYDIMTICHLPTGCSPICPPFWRNTNFTRSRTWRIIWIPCGCFRTISRI